MKIAVVGANGQLGSELVRALSAWDVVPLVRPACDVRDGGAVRDTLRRIRPAAVVNTAAMTDVDACEGDVRQAVEVNACGVRHVAGACARLGAVLVHVSTDYVFGGEKRAPYREDDAPRPLNVYGVSKTAGEYFARAVCPRCFVVRTSGLYGAAGARGKGGNFVEAMIRMGGEGRPIRVVDDQLLAPTYAPDLARAIERLILTEAYGIYHVTNAGACSWYAFARRIFERVGSAPDLSPVTSAAWAAPARRPPYSVLATDKFVRICGSGLRPWAEALDAYLEEQGHVGRRPAAAARAGDFGPGRQRGAPGPRRRAPWRPAGNS